MMMQENEIKPWAQLPEENATWFARFTEWLHQDLPRSLVKVYRATREGKGRERQGKKRSALVDSVPGSWAEATITYNWRARAAAWDTAEHARKEREWAIARDEERHTELMLAVKLRAKAEELLSLPLVVQEITPDQVHVFSTASTLLAQAKAHARAALELPDKFNRQEVSAKIEEPTEVSPLVKLTPVERLERILAIVRQIPAKRNGEEEGDHEIKQ